MSKLIIVSLALVATFAVTSAITPEEKLNIKAKALPLLEACGQELDISKEDVLAAKESKDVDALNPCFYSCFFKKIGIINKDGLFDAAVAKEKSSQYVSGDESIQKISDIVTTCSDVNDQAVSDAEKGCERAKLLLQCFLKEKYTLVSA